MSLLLVLLVYLTAISILFVFFFFFFKQKTAYEMRISDWSSDVCSSDLQMRDAGRILACNLPQAFAGTDHVGAVPAGRFVACGGGGGCGGIEQDRKSVV